ncbi:uncharacterized protein EAE98_008280 [Botrytis deweyae]|uniref:PARP-type domain-containing protein n=1 Tax=Botrytis deweyae TaxID=2478750 RepID=A0ABQ7IFA2_9HELO|nr:uncharacterized protein EAE98_008280 [Botrytis deweyae]KAF7922069.1 hypothetical protein EAE98_008280 [Botrytis deweyae]
MSYRVELATTARAGCQNKECKDNGVKIQKNELRLGTWVEIQEHGGWQWKHWGCVTGKQLENMRNYLEDGKGGYMFDKMDGYNDGGKGSLDDHPEMQEKVRRVVVQGFIDPEDWKGDPEMNILGQTGTRTSESKKKIKEQKSAEMGDLTELQAKWDEAEQEKQQLIDDGKANGMKVKALNKKIAEYAKEMTARRKEEEKEKAERERNAVKSEKANTPKKRSRVKKELDEEGEEDEKPAKKMRGGKVKKEEESEEEVMPVKKARGRKAAVKKEEDIEEDKEDVKPAPVKKSRGKASAVKKEEISEDEEDTKPVLAKTSKGKAPAVKKEEDIEDEEDTKPAPPRNSRAKKPVVKKEVKEENSEDEEDTKPVPVKNSRAKKPVVKKEVKAEDDDENEILTKTKPAPVAKKGGRQSKKVKEEAASVTPELASDNETLKDPKFEAEDEEMKEENEEEEEVKPIVKKSRGHKVDGPPGRQELDPRTMDLLATIQQYPNGIYTSSGRGLTGRQLRLMAAILRGGTYRPGKYSM